MKKILLFTATFIFLGSSLTFANVAQIKAYKEAYPDSKPKCINCHVDALPKKEEGKHEHNAYGKAVLKANPKPTAETYKAVGPVEKFQDKK